MQRQSGLAVPSNVFRLAVENAGPGWFTSVMGTGILAVCAAISPIAVPFVRPFALALWSADTVLFVMLTVLLVVRAVRRPSGLGRTFGDPGTAQLWGAPPMAAFTIAVGFLRIGTTVLPVAWCVAAAQVLWLAGVAGSIACAFAVPYLMFTEHEVGERSALGSWLLPVVPPIVASVPAALLATTWPVALRGDALALAYALLGIGTILAAIVIVIFYSRLVYHKVPQGALVPTMWIVIGPLGQSIAGINALAAAARGVWPALAPGLASAGLVYGVLVWGFAMYWLAMASAITLRAVRRHMPFSLGWWAFTFPVGVLTAGTDALYAIARAPLFAIASLALLALLATLWSIVAAHTVRGVCAHGAVSARVPSIPSIAAPMPSTTLPIA